MTAAGTATGDALRPPMTPERWHAVEAVLQAALASAPDRRAACIAEGCAGDEAMRREVESLLAAHDAADDFLERPAVEALGALPPSHTAQLAAGLAGRYVIQGELARGGMATVYRAHDLRHGRAVALKVLRDEVAAAVGAERFLEEIRVTASLQHPHILPLFDSGRADGLLWYAMPLVEGDTLRARIAREGPLPIDDAVRIAREVAEALDYAHARGVVHRDVKPENVLLQGGHALVADFGIALALEHAGGERLTRTGLTLGTPHYMAPEQAAGERALDARVDVYALGVMLHEMLAGEPPFAGSRQVVLHGVLHEPPPALAARRPDVPPAVAAAVRRALEKRPEARWPGATAFAAALGPLNGVGWGGPGEAGAALASAGAPAAPRSAAAAGRTVAVRAVMYAALAGIGLGVPAGWMLARSALATRWANRTSVFLTPTTAGADGAPGVLVPPSPAGAAGDAALVLVDRAGRPVRALAAERPWTPRFSPDGRRVAYGAFGPGRGTSDLWVTDFEAGTTRRLTDDDADANDPQWSPDGTVLAYSVGAPGGKDLAAWPLNGGAPRVLAVRAGIQFASDWLPDGRALLVTQDAGDAQQQRDIFVQPTDGSAARPYAVTTADETAARVSPDGRWVAYTSDASGRPEVYLDAYPRPGRRVRVSSGGGVHPVWRRDGRELYYWRDDALVAVSLGAAGGEEPPAVTARTDLFRAPYEGGLNTMYDASPDGARFVVVRRR